MSDRPSVHQNILQESTFVRAIAFYLPQFHAVAENDTWWGRGFTEWTNVVRGHPLFPGHYQPHLPADLGFYDLRLAEVRQAQAELAREYGIHGFCYYHYWFNGRRILERPFQEVLASGKPDFPVCLCWANENWTRVWDGGDRHVLLEQHYSPEDDIAIIKSLIPAFSDPRYIRVDGRPLFLVYRTELLPDPAATAMRWRQVAVEAGLPGLYLARVEHFVAGTDPATIGFDAAVEFAPDGARGKIKYRGAFGRALAALGLIPSVFANNAVVTYAATAEEFSRKPDPGFRRFFGVTPMWDNSARRKAGANIYVGSTPTLYGKWLRSAIERTLRRHHGDERIIFINAWNEWAEGCHLEPDQRWGRAYLEETRRVLAETTTTDETQGTQQVVARPRATSDPFRRLWWRAIERARDLRELLTLIWWHARRVE